MAHPIAASTEFGTREGWWLSERDDGFWEIQKFDEADIFETDFDAYSHCKQINTDAEKEALELHGMRWREAPKPKNRWRIQVCETSYVTFVFLAETDDPDVAREMFMREAVTILSENEQLEDRETLDAELVE